MFGFFIFEAHKMAFVVYFSAYTLMVTLEERISCSYAVIYFLKALKWPKLIQSIIKIDCWLVSFFFIINVESIHQLR